MNFFEYFLLKAIQSLLFLLPHRCALFLGEAMGVVTYILGIRRKVVSQNIKIAFSKAYPSIEINFYRNLGASLSEILILNGKDLSSYAEAFIKVEKEEFLKKIQREGEGVIFLSAHLGNWELLPLPLLKYFKKLYAVVHRQHNPYIDKFIQRQRERMGVKTLEKEKMRDAVKLLKNGASLILLADQHPGRGKVNVKFFGIKTPAVTTPIILAKRASAKILPVFILRVRGPYHKMVIYSPMDAEESIQKYYNLLENLIREHPSQWLWAHRRWRR